VTTNDAKVGHNIALAQRFNLELRMVSTFTLKVMKGRGFVHKDKSTPGFYVKTHFSFGPEQKSLVVKQDEPNWNAVYTYSIPSEHEAAVLKLEAMIDRTFFDDCIGMLRLLVADHKPNQPFEGWMPVKKEKEPQGAPQGELYLHSMISPPSLTNFRFLVKQQFFSFGDFTVKDHKDRNVFNVVGSWPNKFYLKDMNNASIIEIKKRSFIALQPSYDLYDCATGAMVLSITHVFSWGMGSKFEVEGSTEPLVIHGDYFARSWHIQRKRDGAMMAQISRLWSFTDHYAIDISPHENIALLISAVVVVDYEVSKDRNRRR